VHRIDSQGRLSLAPRRVDFSVTARGRTGNVADVAFPEGARIQDARYVAATDGYAFAGTHGSIINHVDVTVVQGGQRHLMKQKNHPREGTV